LKFLAVLFLLVFKPVIAHEAHRAGGTTTPAPTTPPSQVLRHDNEIYNVEVLPIFRAKCFDCHSKETRHPWYYRLPVAKQIIDRDVKKGLEHLDLSRGFPFGGHHSPEEQLEAIRKVVEKDSMPIKRYRWLHRGSALTPEEKQTILRWVEASQAG